MGPAGRDNDEALRLWNTRKENVSKDGACPFCGSTHFVMRTTSWHQSHGYDRGALVCSDCGASGPVGTVMPPK
jgi:transcription elongation factor Elf1